ncbi:hypothetical protein [Paenibacillus andongensis]|uniref:hypothetical protein n=1 Tax=Paenibacillus andongensis TaxID=2975482 RepID=UPI0021BB27B8|nr:hypothetical protein [Paenibacillus andongensis]
MAAAGRAAAASPEPLLVGVPHGGTLWLHAMASLRRGHRCRTPPRTAPASRAAPAARAAPRAANCPASAAAARSAASDAPCPCAGARRSRPRRH